MTNNDIKSKHKTKDLVTKTGVSNIVFNNKMVKKMTKANPSE
jgi:hypothetical protein